MKWGRGDTIRTLAVEVRVHGELRSTRAAEPDDLVEVLKEGLCPLPMRLRCEVCHELHVDEGDFATKPHHTHACQHCGHVWRPAVFPTVGVRFLPGFKNEPAKGESSDV